LYNGTLEGTTSAVFDTVTSQVNFYSLNLTMLGMTVVKFHITSSPADYDFYVEQIKHNIVYASKCIQLYFYTWFLRGRLLLRI
jgi:hypothetical protein